jgi:hypothetical protein
MVAQMAGGRAGTASILRLPPGAAAIREVQFRRHRGEGVMGERSVVVIGGLDGAR